MWQTSDNCAGTWSRQPQYAWWYVTPHKNQFQSTVCGSILLCDYRQVHRNKMSTVMTEFVPELSFFFFFLEWILSSKFHRPKAIPVICVFLSSFSDMQIETFLYRIVSDGLSGYDVFLVIISYRGRFSKKKYAFNTQCVLIFVTTPVWNVSHFWEEFSEII